jgi:hypothetical protein
VTDEEEGNVEKLLLARGTKILRGNLPQVLPCQLQIPPLPPNESPFALTKNNNKKKRNVSPGLNPDPCGENSSISHITYIIASNTNYFGSFREIVIEITVHFVVFHARNTSLVAVTFLKIENTQTKQNLNH